MPGRSRRHPAAPGHGTHDSLTGLAAQYGTLFCASLQKPGTVLCHEGRKGKRPITSSSVKESALLRLLAAISAIGHVGALPAFIDHVTIMTSRSLPCGKDAGERSDVAQP